MSNWVRGHELIEELVKAGVVPEDTTRVVIDAAGREAVKVYAELIGNDSLIRVLAQKPLGGAEVRVVVPRPIPQEGGEV